MPSPLIYLQGTDDVRLRVVISCQHVQALAPCPWRVWNPTSRMQGEVLTSRGDLNMALFPDGFPWEDRTPKEMLGPKFIKVGCDATEESTRSLLLTFAARLSPSDTLCHTNPQTRAKRQF